MNEVISFPLTGDSGEFDTVVNTGRKLGIISEAMRLLESGNGEIFYRYNAGEQVLSHIGLRLTPQETGYTPIDIGVNTLNGTSFTNPRLFSTHSNRIDTLATPVTQLHPGGVIRLAVYQIIHAMIEHAERLGDFNESKLDYRAAKEGKPHRWPILAATMYINDPMSYLILSLQKEYYGPREICIPEDSCIVFCHARGSERNLYIISSEQSFDIHVGQSHQGITFQLREEGLHVTDIHINHPIENFLSSVDGCDGGIDRVEDISKRMNTVHIPSGDSYTYAIVGNDVSQGVAQFENISWSELFPGIM